MFRRPLESFSARYLQRILLNARSADSLVFCHWVGTSSLRKGGLFHARSTHQPRKGIISLDATRLVIDSIFLLALPGELPLDGPWPHPHGRIVDRDLISNLSRAGARPAFDHMQVLPRTPKISLRTEVRHVDDESISLPVASRIAKPLADVGRQMRAPVHDDVPLIPLALAHVVEDGDATGCLHDPPEADA